MDNRATALSHQGKSLDKTDTSPGPSSTRPENKPLQHTLAQPFTCQGVGLHLGQQTTVRVMPATADEGRYFVRVDLADPVAISTDVTQVSQTRLSTELGQGEGTVRTVEHLLASLWALGIDNARIEIDGPEVPLLDGSAQGWVKAIQTAGIQAQSVPRVAASSLTEPVVVQDKDAYVVALPSSELRLSYGIDFDLEAIGNQWHSWSPRASSFATTLAPARTFGLAHQIDFLRNQGLIKGGSLENALVCGAEGWINPPLRFANEPVRHKLLDLVGDLSLLGVLPTMHVTAYRASHQLHVELARKLAAL